MSEGLGGKIKTAAAVARHPAFQQTPLRVIGRMALWTAHCAAGRPATVELGSHGARLHLPPKFLHGGSGGVFVLRERYEPEVGWLEATLKPGMGFVDGGANLGIYTVLASSLVGPTGRVLSFEPGELSYSRLQRNVQLNGVGNVRAINKALSDHSGRAQLFHTRGGPVGYSLTSDEGPETEYEEVEITTIDETVEQEGVERVDVIKLDVEGEEERALRGAAKTLERHRPAVLFEFLPNTPLDQGQDRTAAWRFLEGLGYGLWCAADGQELTALSAPRVGNNIAIAR